MSTSAEATGGPWSLVAFVVVVLVLSGTQRLAGGVAAAGRPSATWLEALTLLLGGGFSPLWAAIIVGVLTMGWAEVRRALVRSIRLPARGYFYVVAAVGPAFVVALAVIIIGSRPSPPHLEPALLLVQVILIALLFALGENLGWRTWLQRGLQERLSPLVAGTLVGVVWGIWHLPLFAPDSPSVHAELPFPSFFALLVAFSVLLAALFNASRGAVLPVVVAHVSFNVATQLKLPATAGQASGLFLVAAALFATVATLIAWRSRSFATRLRPAIL